MVVTARFVCESIKHYGAHNDYVHFEVVMRATSAKDPMDNNYSKWTPNGTFEITVTNPALEGYFKPGETYGFEITHLTQTKDA